jgi:hypothetical protein
MPVVRPIDKEFRTINRAYKVGLCALWASTHNVERPMSHGTHVRIVTFLFLAIYVIAIDYFYVLFMCLAISGVPGRFSPEKLYRNDQTAAQQPN